MGIYISERNTKVGKTPNFSLPPQITCIDGRPCAEKCYAMKAWKQYPNVRKAWMNNYKFFIQSPSKCRKEIAAFILKHNPRYFRIHPAGDFFAQWYVDVWRSLAEQFPKTKFLAYTKRIDLDFTATPKNLIIRFSHWGLINTTDGQKTTFDALPIILGHSSVWTALDKADEEEFEKSGIKQCKGKCGRSCRFCWNSKEAVFFKLH